MLLGTNTRAEEAINPCVLRSVERWLRTSQEYGRSDIFCQPREEAASNGNVQTHGPFPGTVSGSAM